MLQLKVRGVEELEVLDSELDGVEQPDQVADADSGGAVVDVAQRGAYRREGAVEPVLKAFARVQRVVGALGEESSVVERLLPAVIALQASLYSAENSFLK